MNRNIVLLIGIYIGIVLIVIFSVYQAYNSISLDNFFDIVASKKQLLNITMSPSSPINIVSSPSPSIPLTKPEDKTVKNNTNFWYTPYLYPSSSIKSQSPSQIILTAHAPTKKVTDWYKKITSLKNIKNRSFVTTEINGSYNNVIAFTDENNNIKITIKGNYSNSTITIETY